MRWNGFPEEIPTADKKYIWIDETARWRIEDPLFYLQTTGNEDQALARLDDIIDASTRNAITKRGLIEVVRTDNREMRVGEQELRETINVGHVTEGRSKIVDDIAQASQESCKEYGIHIDDAGILVKGLTYVDSVKKTVEDRMISERQRIAEKYISEGEGEFQRITGEKDKEVQIIISGAYKEAQRIIGAADALVTRVYADGLTNNELQKIAESGELSIGGITLEVGEGMTPEETRGLYGQGFGADPAFYQLWQTLQLYENGIGGGGTRLILGTDSPLMKFIRGIDAAREPDYKLSGEKADSSP